jgi:hypothetical protein
MSIRFKEPKYKHLLNRNFRKIFSKSKNADVYLHLIEYSDAGSIHFDDVADSTGKSISVVKGAMRAARNEESIALALVDLGVQTKDIPPWFKTSKILKVKTRVKKKEEKSIEDKSTSLPGKLPVDLSQLNRARSTDCTSNGVLSGTTTARISPKSTGGDLRSESFGEHEELHD